MSIELPKDAEGREIPLETKVMYGCGGTARNIVYWVFTTDSDLEKEWWNCWRAVTDTGGKIDPGLMHLTPPDSWEKLEEDLDRCIEESDLCMYYNNQNPDCNKCTISGNESRGCTSVALEDIKRRIRKLRGDD